MKSIILDTNFVIEILKNKIDLKGELSKICNFPFKILVLDRIKDELDNIIEKQGGKSILDSLITDTLIKNEAKKKGIIISEDEVNQEIKTIEASVTEQGGTLEQALLQQGMTKESLRESVKNQKIIEKLFADKLKVTDAEVNKYIAENEIPIEEGKEAETKKQIMDQYSPIIIWAQTKEAM